MLGRIRTIIAITGLTSALAAPAAFADAPKSCIDLGAPATQISTACKETADSRSVQVYKAGIAAYNAARAYLRPSGSTADYAAAAQLIEASFRQLPDADLLSNNKATLGFSKNRDWKRWQKAPRVEFRFDRALDNATALEGLATTTPFRATPVCATSDACLNKAIDRLANADIVAPFASANTSDGGRYNEFYYRRGTLFASRGNPADLDSALDNFRKVLDSQRSERKADAAAALERLALKAADENLALGGTSLNQAIRYYGIALAAKPSSWRANKGLGDTYMKLCRDTASTPAQRVPNCLSARSAFDSAKTQASGADLSGVYVGLGESLGIASAELAKLNPNDPNVVLYSQASIDAYGMAASAGGGNAEAQLALAKALEGSQPAQASDAYRNYVGQKLAYPEWIAAGWQLPVASQFQQKLNMVSAGTDRRNIAEAILAIYRLQKGSLNHSVKLSLLEAARAAQPSMNDASIEIGKLYLKPPANYGAAYKAFHDVILATGGDNGPPSAGQEATRAEAFYQLSRVEAAKLSVTTAQTSDSGVDYAQKAFSLNGGEVRYKKAACLAYITTFKVTRDKPATASWCSGIGGSDGQLLLGMYFLRVAQTAPMSQRNGLRDEAQTAFIQGLRLVPQAVPPAKPEVFKSEWPGADDSMPMTTLLEYGRGKSIACNGASLNLPLTPEEIGEAEKQFKFFQLGPC
ncbi:hypothetical protein [Hyphomonas johnsonii]|uniref:Lipoprotein n=1 Tax=Hyphomonas johnsonii MHS-2 TaxID=1280950 RepID=A0A059FS87_9PROT|nr:hypothetical protein [Hyphomonas johnsonii]KCZ93338.1 hypothetical protein HJO_05765 [Hyphomonas johnsonii MHS-2]